MSDDLSPGVWPIVRSRGDGFTPTAFSVEVDDVPLLVPSVDSKEGDSALEFVVASLWDAYSG